MMPTALALMLPLAFAPSLAFSAAPPQCEAPRWGVHASDVGQQFVYLWTALPAGTRARFAVDDGKSVRKTPWKTAPASGMHSERIAGLSAGRDHTYWVERRDCATAPDSPSNRGKFRTLPKPDSPEPVRFLWSADLGGQNLCRKLEGGYAIFNAMLREGTPLFIFAGDIIYADTGCTEEGGNVPGPVTQAATLEEFRKKYLYQLEDWGARAFLANTATLATPDDHEVSDDFAGEHHPLARAGLTAFHEVFPNAAPASEPGRVYRGRRLGKAAELFILDTRQYRSPNLTKDGPGKTMLGKTQLEWLLSGLEASTATWKIIVSSVPLSFPTGYPAEKNGRDGWTGYFPPPGPGMPPKEAGEFPGKGTGFMHELRKIRDRIASARVRNVIFLTADAHRAHAIEYGSPDGGSGVLFREYIAGPLSAFPGWPSSLDPELKPRSLFERIGVFNYGVVSADPKRLTVRIADVAGRTLFEHSVEAGAQ